MTIHSFAWKPCVRAASSKRVRQRKSPSRRWTRKLTRTSRTTTRNTRSTKRSRPWRNTSKYGHSVALLENRALRVESDVGFDSKVMKNLFVLVFAFLLGAVAPALRAQHEEHEKAASNVEKPVVFLDKSPRIVAYQLGRLSNEQLLLVDSDTSDSKYVPVYQAILTRPGMAAKHRQEAVSALAKLNKTSEPAELFVAIKGLDAAQSRVL